MMQRLKDFIRFKPGREQLICIAAAIVLAAGSYYMTSSSSFLQSGNTIERAPAGGIDKNYELKVRGIGDKEETISVRVSSRKLSESEAVEQMDLLIEELAVYIRGNNPDLNHVSGDLNLKKSIAEYGGIRLSWYPEDTGLISYEGKVSNLELEAPKETSLKLIMKGGNVSREYVLPVVVLPLSTKSEEELKNKLINRIKAADSEQEFSGELILPTEIDGLRVFYQPPANTDWLKILALGAAAAVLVGMRPGQEKKQQMKKRESELLADYSEVVTKLVIYMGAGLTVRNAWNKIVANYAESKTKNGVDVRVVYEEMTKTAQDMDKGVPESKALADFADRCSPGCYLKLVSILEQYRKTGDQRSETALLMEAKESFEQRKNIAKRLGEEASTKLMLPLIISLFTVMVIVAVPAMLTLN